jgi:DNA-binding IclR family transcriptional regulator
MSGGPSGQLGLQLSPEHVYRFIIITNGEKILALRQDFCQVSWRVAAGRQQAGAKMRTVEKALKLLDLFTVAAPQWGLSDIARAAGLDKATTLRMLSALVHHGMLDQQADTRKYRLGPTVLKLARVRESSFPAASVVQPVLNRLAEFTGETAHASLAASGHLLTIAIAEPQRTTRVHVDPSEPLPFHATASGIAYLAFAPEGATESVLRSGGLSACTPHTHSLPEELRADIADARQRGFAIARKTFEDEVIGIAAPVFDWSGYAQCAIGVASVASRVTPESERKVASVAVGAGIEVTRAMGAEPHADVVAAGEGFFS